MAEYRINAIDEAEPRRWDGPNGAVFYITVGLEGHQKPVSIGKKSPDALKIGDTVWGTIIPTDFTTDKWKGEAPATSSRTQKWQPKDETSVTLNMVWKNLINVVGVPTDAEDKAKFWEMVRENTEGLLAMGNGMKSGSGGGSKTDEQSPSIPTIKEPEPPTAAATSPIQERLKKGFDKKPMTASEANELLGGIEEPANGQ